jgi:hypothetical protein
MQGEQFADSEFPAFEGNSVAAQSTRESVGCRRRWSANSTSYAYAPSLAETVFFAHGQAKQELVSIENAGPPEIPGHLGPPRCGNEWSALAADRSSFHLNFPPLNSCARQVSFRINATVQNQSFLRIADAFRWVCGHPVRQRFTSQGDHRENRNSHSRE